MGGVELCNERSKKGLEKGKGREEKRKRRLETMRKTPRRFLPLASGISLDMRRSTNIYKEICARKSLSEVLEENTDYELRSSQTPQRSVQFTWNLITR